MVMVMVMVMVIVYGLIGRTLSGISECGDITPLMSHIGTDIQIDVSFQTENVPSERGLTSASI